MLITKAVSEKGRINLKIKSAKKFCINLADEETAVAEAKLRGEDNVAFAIFSTDGDANQAIELASEIIAYFKKYPQVLDEPIYRRK